MSSVNVKIDVQIPYKFEGDWKWSHLMEHASSMSRSKVRDQVWWSGYVPVRPHWPIVSNMVDNNMIKTMKNNVRSKRSVVVSNELQSPGTAIKNDLWSLGINVHLTVTKTQSNYNVRIVNTDLLYYP